MERDPLATEESPHYYKHRGRRKGETSAKMVHAFILISFAFAVGSAEAAMGADERRRLRSVL